MCSRGQDDGEDFHGSTSLVVEEEVYYGCGSMTQSSRKEAIEDASSDQLIVVLGICGAQRGPKS
jgi:hypothetical protein